MRIMFNIRELTNGGAERVICNLSNNLINNNEVYIVTTINNANIYELDERIVHYVIDEVNNKNIVWRNIKRLIKLNSIIKQINPDIIVSFLPEPSYRVLFLKIFNRKKIIVSNRSDPTVVYNRRIRKLLMNLLYPLADGLVLQTDETKLYFKKSLQSKSVVIPNPLNQEFVCEPYHGQRDKTIVTVGRISRQKNHRLLIDAYIKSRCDYNLLIYGEGPLKKELVNYVNRLGYNKKIKFMGYSINIKKDIYKAGIFVLSSDYEGMPNALIEAMSLGIPSISTDFPYGGARFLIKNNYNGLLVKVNDVNELSMAITKLTSDFSLYQKISSNARLIQKKLNPKKVSKQWLDYMKKIANSR